MNVLALDMTLRNTGYSLWTLDRMTARWDPVECGCLRTKTAKGREYAMLKDIQCTQELHRDLAVLVEKHQVRALVVELLGGSQSARSARTFGLVIGLLAILLEQYKLPLYTYTATAVKKAITGSKSASKERIIAAIEELYPGLFAANGFERSKKTGKWPGKIEHVADSVALMLHAEAQLDFRTITQMALADAPAPEEFFE